MHLTREQEELLENGRIGERKAMEILCALGDVFEADRLIPISSAHVSGVSYKTIGDAGIDFLTEISQGTGVKVRTTANPIAMDRRRWMEMGIPEDFSRKQLEIVALYEKMGVSESWTCTPYLAGNLPSQGDTIAWAESSAVAFANSVIGARSNREGGPSALASAITGLTPRYGMHLEEKRKATVIVDVSATLKGSDIASLGCIVGDVAKDGVPYLKGLAPGIGELKSLGAAMASTGSIALFHVEGVTPEHTQAVTDDAEKVVVSRDDLDRMVDELSSDGNPDLVAVGCPHLSLEELKSLTEAQRTGESDTEFWICTSRHVYEQAHELLDQLEGIGKVLCDTCMVVCPIEDRSQTVATDSGKAAFYLPKFCSQKVIFDDVKNLMERFL